MSCRLGALQHHYAPHAAATAIPAVHEPDIYNDFNGSHSAAPTAAPATKLQTTKELATDRVLQMIERRGLPLPISVELALETFTSSVDDRLIRHENLAQIDLKNLLRAEMQIGVDTPEPRVLTRRGGICWLKRVGKALGSVPQAVYDSCALGFVVYAETDPNNFLAFFELTPHATNDTKWSARDIRTGETFAAVSLLLPVPLQANFFKILQQRPDIRYSGVILSGDRGAAQEMIVRVPDELLHSTGRETFEILRNLMETLYKAPTKTQRGLDTFAKHFVEWLVRKVPGWAEGKIPDDFISCATAAWISVATLTTAPAEQAPVFETSATTSEQCLEPIDQQAVDMQVHGCLKGCGLMLSRRSEDSPREREYDLVDRKLTEVKRVRRDELNPECCCVVELKYKHFGCKHASWSNPTPVAHLCCLDQKPFHVGCRLWQHRSFADCETNPELSTMPAPGEA